MTGRRPFSPPASDDPRHVSRRRQGRLVITAGLTTHLVKRRRGVHLPGGGRGFGPRVPSRASPSSAPPADGSPMSVSLAPRPFRSTTRGHRRGRRLAAQAVAAVTDPGGPHRTVHAAFRPRHRNRSIAGPSAHRRASGRSWGAARSRAATPTSCFWVRQPPRTPPALAWMAADARTAPEG